MVLNPNVVPKALIPLFQAGQIIRLWNFQDEFGGGLALFNAIRRAYPNQPGVPNDFYLSLVSWLQGFLTSSKNAANYLNQLPQGTQADPNVLPKNFYVRRPPDSTCGFQLAASYQTRNTVTGNINDRMAYKWFSDLSDIGAIKNVFSTDIVTELGYVSNSIKSHAKYELLPDSIQFTGAIRIC